MFYLKSHLQTVNFNHQIALNIIFSLVNFTRIDKNNAVTV
ncbi:hypothetical protein CAMRE0001_0891 [Campylobacter rectus RM3267]|uniref:Uncharacterized protein n=1 Tax=Campylobacter rectus RM3267 TaxID=553218 RepID=B9D215_CAMRE|nr:hypothetical protein CAMRE0001_0891 [Campylobacter rectus RM3267]